MNKAVKETFPPKFGSVQVIERIYGISNTAVIQILRDFPEIEYFEITRPGKKYGRRLVNLESFQKWFESQKVDHHRQEESVAAWGIPEREKARIPASLEQPIPAMSEPMRELVDSILQRGCNNIACKGSRAKPESADTFWDITIIITIWTMKLYCERLPNVSICTSMRRKVSISVRVFEDEKEELSKFAEEDDQSIDRLARIMIRQCMQERRNKAYESSEVALANMEFQPWVDT
jgi:hypothetical protein